MKAIPEKIRGFPVTVTGRRDKLVVQVEPKRLPGFTAGVRADGANTEIVFNSPLSVENLEEFHASIQHLFPKKFFFFKAEYPYFKAVKGMQLIPDETKPLYAGFTIHEDREMQGRPLLTVEHNRVIISRRLAANNFLAVNRILSFCEQLGASQRSRAASK